MSSTQAVSLQIIPTQSSKSLLIHPGEPSEFIVKLHHSGTHPMQLDLQVEGDFPLEWCRIGREGTTLLPGQTMEVVLYFQIPGDWFESHSSQDGRSIDRIGRLSIQGIEPATGRRQVEWSDFRLNVRPRSLYLNFLPEIYQEVDFVGRFLKIFEQSFEPSVQILDSLWAYLDPLTAPETLLPFLSHWVAWKSPGYMNPDRQRRCIRHAFEIYRWRGTKYGLKLYLHLATGLPLDFDQPESEQHICIQEFLGGGLVLGSAHLAQDALVGGGKAFHFRVCLKLPEGSDPEQSTMMIDESLIRQIIDQEKPAFCTYDLQIKSA